MILLLFLCLFIANIYSGISQDSFDFPAVNTTWFRSTLLGTFATTRHHVTGLGNKTNAREFIVKHFKNLQLTVEYDEFVSEKLKIPGVNIIGILPGYQHDSLDNIYVVGAYYDTKGITEGMFNNGAGVVAMLESARLLVKGGRKRNTLLFVAFDLHATENRDQERCCQGSKHFVNVWLENYLMESRKTNKNVEFGGTIILESILNYDNIPSSQEVNLKGTLGALMFKDLYTLVALDNNRGNFILVVCRDQDAELQKPFTQIWNFLPGIKAKIHSLQFSLGFTNDLIYEIIEEKVFESDLLPFYMKNENGIGITDTEQFRGEMKTCYKTRCNETALLTNEKISFVAKTIGTVVLTVEVLGIGNTSGFIIAHMRNQSHISTTTTATVPKSLEPTCPNADYFYDGKADIYYKSYMKYIEFVPWSEAKTVCENEGAQLLILHSKKMLEFAVRKTPYSIWVGMSDIQHEGEWKWVDGTNVTSEFWDTCQPDNSQLGEDCGMLHIHHQKLIDVDCNFFYKPFICTCKDNETLSMEVDFQEEECFVTGYTMVEKEVLYYKVFETSLNHNEAENTCIRDGVHLLSISTLYEYSFIDKLSSELSGGLYHIHSDERFYQLFLKTDLENASSGILNAGKDRCYVLDGSTLSLDTRNCSDKLPFICGLYCKEKDLIKAVPDKPDYEQGYFEKYEILASTDNGLKHYNIETEVRMSFIGEITTGEPVYSMDILYEKNILFWHSRESTFIMETAMKDSPNYSHRRFVNTGDLYTYIAVDWLYENVYWSCMVLQTISVSNGNYTKILYMQDINKPRFLQLDSFTGLLIWLEPLGVIFATMDGQEKVQAINGNFDQLVVDSFLKTMFISHNNFITRERLRSIEDKLNHLIYHNDFESVDCLNKFRSSNQFDAKVHGGNIPFKEYTHLIFTDNFYVMAYADIIFIDNNSLIGMKNIYQPGKRHSLFMQNVIHLNETWSNVKIIDERKIKCLHQECSYVNDSCSQLKLPSFKGSFSCVCPLDGVFLTAKEGSCDINICLKDNGKCSQQCTEMDYYPYVNCSCYEGFQLLLDEKTCIKEHEAQTLILFSNKVDLELYLPQGKFEYRKKISIEDFETYDTAGITFDPLDFHIYWVQDKAFSIRRAYINGTGKEECYAGSSKELWSLTLDVFQRRLMFSVPENSSIESVDTNGKLYQIDHQLSNAYFPSSFVLDNFNGFIYYHQQNRFKLTDTEIIRLDIETKEVEVIIEKIIGPAAPRSFDVDHKDGMICFIGGTFKEQIEKQQIHGTEGKVIVPKTQMIQYTHIYLLDDELYTIGRQGEFGRYNIKEDTGELFNTIHHKIISIAGGQYHSKSNKNRTNVETCVGISKCLDARMGWICLTPEQICDGVDQCYDSYDEMYCEYEEHRHKYTYIHLSCLKQFPPHGHVYDRQDLLFVNWKTHLFSRYINVEAFLLIRCSVEYEISNLIESSKQMFKLPSFNVNHRFRQIIKSNVLRGRHHYIRKLVLSGQGLSQTWSRKTFEDLKNLRILELLDITLQVLRNGILINLSQLNTLQLRLKSLVQIESEAFIGIHQCQTLKISDTKISRFHPKTFNNLKKLISLDISNNKLVLLEKEMFTYMTSLQILDTRGNDIYIVERLFDANINLKLIYSDTFSLCCVTPKHMPVDDCKAPRFDVSSCEHLIENNDLRIFLWVIGLLAVVGNICVLIYRKTNEGLFNDTFSVLVGNLTVADGLIGVYLISIGIADVMFRGEYIWREYKWRNSTLCSLLGILSVLSSEVSVLSISLVTVARYFAVRFPFKEHKISRRNAVTGCILIWIFSLSMGLFPYFAFENYYSSSGVCVSLPLRKEPTATAGWTYSFSLFVVFNFLTFLFIALAQGPIVLEVKKISSSVQRTGDLKHIKVAKRLSLVIATDCLCWIPIGTMGVMAMFGYDMPRTIYAWTVVFVLPINSAINPFLYTFIDTQMLLIVKQFLRMVYKASSKLFWKMMGTLGVAISIVMIIGILLLLIKDFEDIFKRHRELYQELSEKRHDIESLKSLTISLHLKLDYLREDAQNDNCQHMLKKTGTGFCCLDWTAIELQCFKISSDRRNWPDAEVGCRQYGHLVTLEYDYISPFLKSIMVNSGHQNSSFWIGNRLFQFSGRSKDFDCYTLQGSGRSQIRKHPCFEKKGFICKIEYGNRRTYVPASICPYAWYKIGMSCFLIDLTFKSWILANERCQLYDDTYLATIDSAEVNDLLQPLLRKRTQYFRTGVFWTGLRYLQGDWRWVKTAKPARYTNWGRGQPQTLNHCAVYERNNDDFTWAASEKYDCDYLYYSFICEKELHYFYH